MKTNSALKKIAIALAVGAVSVGAATPAMADHGRGYGHHRHYERYYPGDRYAGYYGDRGYYRDVRYDRGYRGYRGYGCRDDGAGGAVIGAIAGGLIGHEASSPGNRTTGTVVGGALGAVAGHLIDKSDGRRC